MSPDRLVEGLDRVLDLNLESRILKGILVCSSRVKSVHMKYEILSNLVSIGYQTGSEGNFGM